jgi:hypothetical protein
MKEHAREAQTKYRPKETCPSSTFSSHISLIRLSGCPFFPSIHSFDNPQ